MFRLLRGFLLVAAVMGALVAQSASATAATGRVFGGTVKSAGDAIVLNADAHGRAVTKVVLAWEAKCSDGQYWVAHDAFTALAQGNGMPRTGRFNTKHNAKGSFDGSALNVFVSRDGATVYSETTTVTGRLTATGATGTISGTAIVSMATPPADPAAGIIATCVTGQRTWSATRRPGIVYGGATSIGEPIVLRLAATRRKIAELDFGWHASCPGGDFVDFSERFRSVALKAGRFDGLWSVPAGANLFAYAVAGTIGRTSAKGTMNLMEQIPGQALCQTGNLRWSASSG
ncbi:MAG TPA: hypothetical protein VII98_04870 [Solirubrobacteraceae bacterium]